VRVAIVDDGYLSVHKNARFLAGIFYRGGDSDHCLNLSKIKAFFDLKNSGIRKYIRRMCG
jgi:hypothetical protein